MENNNMDNLIKGNFNNQENAEQVLPTIEMLAKIWNIPTTEVSARLMREYEDAVKKEAWLKEKENLPKLPEDIKKRVIHVLNQKGITPDNAKLPEHAPTEEILSAYRKYHNELQNFVQQSTEEWKPTGDDKKDIDLLISRFKLD
jgi:hypothetical protein